MNDLEFQSNKGLFLPFLNVFLLNDTKLKRNMGFNLELYSEAYKEFKT